jgi:hypothetical protein
MTIDDTGRPSYLVSPTMSTLDYVRFAEDTGGFDIVFHGHFASLHPLAHHTHIHTHKPQDTHTHFSFFPITAHTLHATLRSRFPSTHAPHTPSFPAHIHFTRHAPSFPAHTHKCTSRHAPSFPAHTQMHFTPRPCFPSTQDTCMHTHKSFTPFPAHNHFTHCCTFA